jgi:pimeloyl-ACP methyl ester carboxylesterase
VWVWPCEQVVNALSTRVGLIYGEDSMIVNPPTQRLMRARLGAHIPMVGLPDAEPHLFLDQPLSFVTGLCVAPDLASLHPTCTNHS